MSDTTSLADITVPHTVVLPNPRVFMASQRFEASWSAPGPPFAAGGGSVAEREGGRGGKATNGMCGGPEL